MAQGDNRRVAITAGGLILSAPASYVVQRALGAWGVLDDVSDALGKWLKVHVPPETAGWTIALIFVVTIYILLLWKVWRPRHIHHGELSSSVTIVPSIEMEVIRAPKEQRQAASLVRQFKRETGIEEDPDTILDALEGAHERLAPKWVALDDSIRHIADESQWGAAQDHADPNFSVNVGLKIRDALACGDLAARGRTFHVLQGGVRSPPLHPLVPIAAEFWQHVIIDAYWPLNGQAQNIGGRRVENVVRTGDHDGMHDIQVDARRVLELWPPDAERPRATVQTSPRHAEILQALSRPLATVQEQTLTYGTRDVAAMLAAKSEAEALIAEIPYDEGTVRTVRDFLQACAIAVGPHDTAVAHREARQDVDRIAPGLFRQLHAGVSVNRQEVDLPAWTRFGDTGGPNEG